MNRGFSLIELMIAIGLGSVIIMVSVSGVRVTAQTVTAANRLSTYNGILRTAIVAANEEMDFWDSFDSRSDAARRPLRQIGRPFQPLAFNTATTHLDFTHKNVSQWWNGHAWSSNNKRWGDYSIFGKQGLNDPLIPNQRQWRHAILQHVTTNLGYYAALDYLPANFVYGFYNSSGLIPNEFGSYAATGPGQFHTPSRTMDRPWSKIELGHNSGYMITTVAHPSGHPNSHRAVYANNGGTWEVSHVRSNWNLAPSVDFLPVGAVGQPMHWPTVAIRTRVTYFFHEFIHESQISLVDRYTGESASIRLQGLTTTLRGARRQRGLDTEGPERWEP